jgi:hypothetical protein
MNKWTQKVASAYVQFVVMTSVVLAALLVFLLTIPLADESIRMFRDLCAYVGKEDTR